MSDTINVGDGIVVCRTMQDPTKNIRAQFAFRTEFEARAPGGSNGGFQCLGSPKFII